MDEREQVEALAVSKLKKMQALLAFFLVKVKRKFTYACVIARFTLHVNYPSHFMNVYHHLGG
jgi:hypothetical protein